MQCTARQLPQASTARQATKAWSSSTAQIPLQGRKEPKVNFDTGVTMVCPRRSPRLATQSEAAPNASSIAITTPATRKRKTADPAMGGSDDVKRQKPAIAKAAQTRKTQKKSRTNTRK